MIRSIILLLALAGTTHAQTRVCGPNGCYEVSRSYRVCGPNGCRTYQSVRSRGVVRVAPSYTVVAIDGVPVAEAVKAPAPTAKAKAKCECTKGGECICGDNCQCELKDRIALLEVQIESLLKAIRQLKGE